MVSIVSWDLHSQARGLDQAHGSTLKGYLEEFGMKSDEGLPALFYQRPGKNGQGIIVLTHVDDMELYASNRDFKKLVEFLRSKGLKIKVEGPMDETEGSRSFLKRSFRSTNEGDVEITMEVLKLEGAYPKRLPCPSDNGRSSEERRNGSAKRGGPSHVSQRRWGTVASSTRTA